MVIGVDLGGTNIRAGVASNGAVVHQRRELFNTKGSLRDTITQLIEFINPLIQEGVQGIGIGVPSVVDVDNGIVFNAANIPAWERVPLKSILENEFGIPVIVNNDVNCFIIGEHRFGHVKGLKNVVGVSSGTGLGSGIIINNELFNGNNCGAGEIGLLHYLDHNMEYYASGNFFQAFYQTTAEEAHRHALNGKTEARQYWQEFGVHFAQALKSVVYAYDPQAIVLGGSVSKAYNLFECAMHTSLRDFSYPETIKRLKIYQSTNEYITLLGAASLIN